VALATIRSAVRPQGAVLRTALLSLLGVVGVIAGLMAMHTLSVDAATHAPVAAVAPMEHHADDPARSAGMPATSDECGQAGCDPMHAMGLTTCVLALLLVSLVFGAAPRISRWFVNLRTLSRMLLSTLLAAAPTPPSLVALSISRT